MATISLCLISKNEEKRIGTCLSTFGQIADEIIVVDTGSTDNTKEIAKKYGAKVYDHKWDYDFSAARNESFNYATCDYIMWLDCDDMAKDEDIEKLKQLKPNLTKNYYSMWYNYRHDDKGNCTYSFIRDRIVKNGVGFYWDCSIHEALNVWGSNERVDIVVTHTSNHDNGEKYIRFFEHKMKNGYKMLPREKYYYGGECYVFGYIDKCINILEDFVKDNYHGIYENKRTRDYLGKSYMIKKDYDKALYYYLQYMKFDQPNENIIRSIGECCMKLGRINEAIFWYEIVANMDFPIDNSTTINRKSDIITACLQLCIIYYKLKNIEKSEYYNNKILKIDPNNSAALYNNNFFNSLKK